MENTRFVIDRMNHFGKMMRKKRFGPVRNVMKILKRPAQGTSNSRFTTLDFAISRFTALFSLFHDSRHFFREFTFTPFILDFTIHATFFAISRITPLFSWIQVHATFLQLHESRHFFPEFTFTSLYFDFTVTFTFTFNEIYWVILWIIVLDACCRSGRM